MRNRRALSLLLLAAAPSVEPAATVDVLLGSERMHVPLTALAERVSLAPDQNFRTVEVGRDAGTSHHLVAIRTA